MTARSTRTVAVPGDKSLSHRALIFAALANGRSTLAGVLDSADVRSTAECLRRLGVTVPPIAAKMTIEGKGAAALRDPTVDLDCGNSGTSTRLLAGLIAGAGRTARLVGDASLSKRPMKRVSEPLQQMGARFEFEHGDGLPMRIVGARLKPIEWTARSASAQVKGALLLAGLSARTSVTVHEPSLSRDHTERMLAALGVPLTTDGTSVTLPANPPEIRGFEFHVPGDPSSAAFFAALALLTGKPVETSLISINKTRTGFFAALMRMGARIDIRSDGLRCGEPVGYVTISGELTAPLALRERDVPSMIDELPLLACLAAYAPGRTTVGGAAELRVKESDRIAAVVSNLVAIGARADERPDGFVIHGERRPLRGAVRTYGDHRIAMAFGILGALPGNNITIDDPDCVNVSFPTFWGELRRLSSPA